MRQNPARAKEKQAIRAFKRSVGQKLDYATEAAIAAFYCLPKPSWAKTKREIKREREGKL